MRATTRLVSLGGLLAVLFVSPFTVTHHHPTGAATTVPVAAGSQLASWDAFRGERYERPYPATTTTTAAPAGPVTHPRVAVVVRQARPAAHLSGATPRGVAEAPPGGVWVCIGRYESGNNPAENTGNGYYGEWQFVASTWQSMMRQMYGPPTRTFTPPYYSYPYAAAAPESMQLAAAQRLQAEAGWGQWPVTSRRCGV